MTTTIKIDYNWTNEALLEIDLDNPDAFLKIKETLTRIGVASKRDDTLYQSCHILHKRGKYYIVHFKELFQLDGRPSDITHEDISRRNTITSLLEQWGLCVVKTNEEYVSMRVPLNSIKVLSHRDKGDWNLVSKYSMRSDRQPK